MKYSKPKLIFMLPCAAMLTCAALLAACTPQKDTPKTVTEPQNITSETISETVIENIAETALTSAVTTPAPEKPVTEEKNLPKHSLSTPTNYDPRTEKYITALTECEKFTDILGSSADILITDLNDDGTPEIIMQIATVVGLSAVFSVKDGAAFMSEPAPGHIPPTIPVFQAIPLTQAVLNVTKKYGESIFIADSFIGGSAGGTGGLMGITFDGRSTASYEISRECIFKYGTDYYWQGEKVSEENYNILWQEYTDSLEYSDKYMVRFSMSLRNSGLCDPMEYIAAGLEGFYQSCDIEKEWTREMKPVFASVRTNSIIADCDNTAVLYDGFGNVSAVYRSINGLTSYKNEYDESGRLCKVTESMRDVSIPDKIYEIDPEDKFEFDRRGYPMFTDNTPGEHQQIEYDGMGRIIKKTHIVSEEIYSRGELEPSVYAPEGFDPDSRVKAVREYEYDTAGNLVREEYTAYLRDGSDKPQHFIHLWEHDSSGRLTGYENGDEYEYYVMNYNENGTPEKAIFKYEGKTYELCIKEHYHDLKGGVTCLWLSGSTPYRENMDCFVYFSPVRTAG